jgi:pyruvate kinase
VRDPRTWLTACLSARVSPSAGSASSAEPPPEIRHKTSRDLAFALELGVDWVALSFVQRPEDLDEVRTLADRPVALVAKLEKPSAVERLDEIVARSDAVMVARGDLGVEMAPEKVPTIQRQILRACRMAGKPVIVATQMLESMIEAPTPTRAEASDVATAV